MSMLMLYQQISLDVLLNKITIQSFKTHNKIDILIFILKQASIMSIIRLNNFVFIQIADNKTK